MITLEIPKIAPILRTTAGVKRLTTVVSGWDNADTERAPDFSVQVQVRERGQHEKVRACLCFSVQFSRVPSGRVK